MRHLRQRSVVMAASAALVLTVGMFSLPQSRAAAEGPLPIGSSIADAPQLVAAAKAQAFAATTTLAPVTVPPTTAAPTTTLPPTTLPPTTLAPAPPPPPPAPVDAQPASGACGGDLPTCCVMMRESHGDPGAVNPSSGASGKWQFMYATWNHYMGYETAASAPEWVQDAKARELWAGGAGASHWAGNGC